MNRRLKRLDTNLPGKSHLLFIINDMRGRHMTNPNFIAANKKNILLNAEKNDVIHMHIRRRTYGHFDKLLATLLLYIWLMKETKRLIIEYIFL